CQEMLPVRLKHGGPNKQHDNRSHSRRPSPRPAPDGSQLTVLFDFASASQDPSGTTRRRFAATRALTKIPFELTHSCSPSDTTRLFHGSAQWRAADDSTRFLQASAAPARSPQPPCLRRSEGRVRREVFPEAMQSGDPIFRAITDQTPN